jgi:hypothetical protein
MRLWELQGKVWGLVRREGTNKIADMTDWLGNQNDQFCG